MKECLINNDMKDNKEDKREFIIRNNLEATHNIRLIINHNNVNGNSNGDNKEFIV